MSHWPDYNHHAGAKKLGVQDCTGALVSMVRDPVGLERYVTTPGKGNGGNGVAASARGPGHTAWDRLFQGVNTTGRENSTLPAPANQFTLVFDSACTILVAELVAEPEEPLRPGWMERGRFPPSGAPRVPPPNGGGGDRHEILTNQGRRERYRLATVWLEGRVLLYRWLWWLLVP